MKKNILAVVFSIILILAATPLPAESNYKLVKIEEPPDGSKDKLLFHIDHIKEIIDDFNLQDASADIQFTGLDGNTLATLGTIKKGEIKWNHKVIDGTSLLVKFDKADCSMILDKIKEKAMKPGFLVQAGFSKKKMSQDQTYGKKTQYVEVSTTLGSTEITFVELPDLTVSMKYPIDVMPGQSLAKDIAITVENKGNAAAKDFNVELVLSSDLQIPGEPASYTPDFKEDVLLEGGRETTATLSPGERLTLELKGSLKVPPDTTPGRYYLAAVIDAEKKIEELDEENNKDVRFIMISVPEPKRLVLEIPDTYLSYEPAGFNLKIVCLGALLSDGKEWRKCMIRPSLHQLKHVGWEGFFWEVDTDERSVWEVKDVAFCKKGGSAKEVKMKVEVNGGSKTTPPARFILKLADTRMEYEPTEGKFRILSFQHQIAYVPLWEIFKIKSHLYQFKHQLWTDSFWEIDTFKKQVSRVTGGTFGKEGGTAAPLDVKLIVE